MNWLQQSFALKYFLFLLFFPSQYSSPAQDICRRDWLAAPYARCYGLNGLEAADLDGDGVKEMVTMARDLWKVLRFDSLTAGYREVYVHEVIEGEIIYHLTAGDVNGDAAPEIITAGSEGVEVFSGSDYRRMARYDLPVSYVNDFLLGDVDNDGAPEWLFSTREQIYVMETASGQITRQLPFGAQWLRLGQVDADAPREVVTSNGRVIQLLEDSYEIEWDRGLPADRLLALGDIDGDGVSEIVETVDEKIEVFNARTQQIEALYETDSYLDALAVIDLAGDGRAEILCHPVNSGQMLGLSTYTGDPIWQAPVRANYLNDLILEDVDGDGGTEIITGEECHTERPSFLRVLEADGTTAWESRDAAGPCRALALRDVNGDGKQEIITLSSRASEEGVLINVYDALSKAQLWESPPKTISPAYSDLQALVVADVDHDDIPEIVVGGGSGIGPRLWVFSGNDFRLERINQYPGSGRSAIQTMTAGDLDGDGRPEIVACTAEENLVFSGPDLNLSRRFGPAPYDASRVFIDNVDGDTFPEIIIHRQYPYVFDGSTGALQGGGPAQASPYHSIDLVDPDADGRREIAGFNGRDSVEVVDAASGHILWSQAVAAEGAVNFRAEDLNGDGQAEWLFSTGRKIVFYDQKGRYSQTHHLGPALGMHDAFQLADGDQDGRPELYLGHAYGALSLPASCFNSCLSLDLQVSVHPAGGPGITNGRASAEVSGGRSPYRYEWSTGETTARTRGVAPGDYWVTVTDAAGCVTNGSATVGIAAPGTPAIPDVNLPPAMSPAPGSDAPVIVFPNPSGGLVNLQWPEPAPEGLYLRLFDVLGRERRRITPAPGSRTTPFSLQPLPDGLYFLEGTINGNNFRIPVRKVSF